MNCGYCFKFKSHEKGGATRRLQYERVIEWVFFVHVLLGQFNIILYIFILNDYFIKDMRFQTESQVKLIARNIKVSNC